MYVDCRYPHCFVICSTGEQWTWTLGLARLQRAMNVCLKMKLGLELGSANGKTGESTGTLCGGTLEDVILLGLVELQVNCLLGDMFRY